MCYEGFKVDSPYLPIMVFLTLSRMKTRLLAETIVCSKKFSFSTSRENVGPFFVPVNDLQMVVFMPECEKFLKSRATSKVMAKFTLSYQLTF